MTRLVPKSKRKDVNIMDNFEFPDGHKQKVHHYILSFVDYKPILMTYFNWNEKRMDFEPLGKPFEVDENVSIASFLREQHHEKAFAIQTLDELTEQPMDYNVGHHLWVYNDSEW